MSGYLPCFTLHFHVERALLEGDPGILPGEVGNTVFVDQLFKNASCAYSFTEVKKRSIAFMIPFFKRSNQPTGNFLILSCQPISPEPPFVPRVEPRR